MANLKFVVGSRNFEGVGFHGIRFGKMKKIATISMFILALLPSTIFAQYEDDNELKFLKKYCADRVDADEYILGFSEKSFENMTIGDKELGDIILFYAESFDDFWPTYGNLESWFMNPITELGRQRTVSFMHIIRSKENYLRTSRPEVISALKQASFP